MSRASAAPRPRPRSKPASPIAKGYFQRSETPLTSLVFLLPFLIVYELGAQFVAVDVRAFNWVQRLFHVFGIYGHHLPPYAVVCILLAWHIATRAPWKVEVFDVLGMWLESLVLCIPLLLLNMVAAQYLPMLAAPRLMSGLVVLSVGGGIYEELVFRLGAFTLLTVLLVDLGKMKRGWANLLMVLISSLAFALHHYWGGLESFSVRTFLFRVIGGVFFGIIFVFRGFGITVGTHATYDIVLHLLSHPS